MIFDLCPEAKYPFPFFGFNFHGLANLYYFIKEETICTICTVCTTLISMLGF